jgi:hypothetical protein
MKSFRGKVVVDNWYIHKESTIYLEPKPFFDEFVRLTRILARVKTHKIPDPYDYQLVKLTVHGGVIDAISFLYVEGWRKYREPVLYASLNYKPKTSEVSIREYSGDSSPVYHHKWMMVMPDMADFDFAASKIRSELWESNEIIKRMIAADPHFKSKIGFKGFWRDVCNKAGIECDY